MLTFCHDLSDRSYKQTALILLLLSFYYPIMNDTKKPQIFIVDDSQIQLILLEKTLVREGFVVKAFLNSFKLLKALDNHRPNLIISDIDMPVLDGFDLIERARSKPEGSDIPFFLISSNGGSDILKKVERAGADAFLQKPLKHQALVNRVSDKIDPVKV